MQESGWPLLLPRDPRIREVPSPHHCPCPSRPWWMLGHSTGHPVGVDQDVLLGALSSGSWDSMGGEGTEQVGATR